MIAMKTSPFNYEREMTIPVLRWLQSNGLQVLREYKTPYGYCDLVAASLHKPRMKQRLRLRQKEPIGPPLRIELLLAVADESAGKPTALSAVCGAYRGYIRTAVIIRELDVLKRRGFIREVSRCSFVRVNGWMPLQRRLLAVELKMTRVGEVLRQAAKNREFASESYVGLPTAVARKVFRGDRLEKVRELGIGLIEISPENCRVIVRPKTTVHPPDQVTQVHCVEQFWRRLAKGSVT